MAYFGYITFINSKSPLTHMAAKHNLIPYVAAAYRLWCLAAVFMSIFERFTLCSVIRKQLQQDRNNRNSEDEVSSSKQFTTKKPSAVITWHKFMTSKTESTVGLKLRYTVESDHHECPAYAWRVFWLILSIECSTYHSPASRFTIAHMRY